jgi:hypothetical protein
LTLTDIPSLRLPEIKKELELNIDKVRTNLSHLPKEPSSNPQLDVATILHGFTKDLALHIEGIPEKNGIIQLLRSYQSVFRRSIRQTAPDFRPYKKESTNKPTFPSSFDFLKSEDDEPLLTFNSKPIYVDEVMQRAEE